MFFGDARPHQELPPRARRIRVHVGPGVAPVGTTSACAENTSRISSQLRAVRNYLRVRGEYLAAFHRSEKISELPPRARRILTDTSVDTTPPGTTSACAENTLLRLPSPPSCWNYLRVRGEYSMISCFSSGTKELPPRARRIQRKSNIPSGFKGTTSACAENTTADPHYMQRSRNYLRVRGEYSRS